MASHESSTPGLNSITKSKRKKSSVHSSEFSMKPKKRESKLEDAMKVINE